MPVWPPRVSTGLDEAVAPKSERLDYSAVKATWLRVSIPDFGALFKEIT